MKTIKRLSPIGAVATLFLSMAAWPACASTSLEQSVINAPMPHRGQFSGGARVKVHFVRLHVDLVPADTVKKIALLPERVRICMEANRHLGLASNPPLDYPDLNAGANTDTYWARNRRIVYQRGYLARLNADCSLKEEESFTATLTSSRGSCQIDLIAKTAEGVCDADAHAGAPAAVLPEAGRGSMQAALARMAADPRGAAAAASIMRLVGPSAGLTGQKKTILGIECDVINGPANSNITACAAHGGSFQPAVSTGNNGEVGMTLENVKPDSVVARATEAQLDAQVGSAVFAPYLSGGYRINSGAGQ